MAEALHPILAQKGIKPGTKEAFIAVAQFYADQKYTEQPKNSNHTLFGAWYGVQTAWCAMFVSYCLNHSGNGVTINGAQSKKGYALCSKGINWFKKHKAWYPVIKAQPGDVAFFDWNHDHDPDHTGIVLKVDVKRKRVLTIEGNTGSKNLSNGGAVMKQWRFMSSIIGVGRPAFPAGVVASPVAPVAPPVVSAAPVVAPVVPVVESKPAAAPVAQKLVKTPLEVFLKVGSKGEDVKYLQQQLHLEVDGVFGPETKAVVSAFQRKHGLDADGVVGPKTWKAIG
jgi:hypothetical protein